MEKLTTQEAQIQLTSILKQVTEQNKTYQIDSDRGTAIIISQQAYESLQETIELLSIPGMRESLQRSLQQIQNQETYSFDEVLGDLD